MVLPGICTSAADDPAAPVSPSDRPPLVQQITGIVRTPDGKPAIKAHVALVVNVYTGNDIWTRQERSEVVVRDDTNEQGRFELHIEKLPVGEIEAVYILARAPQCGLAWLRPNFDDPPLDYELRLPTESQLKGRLLQADGKPVEGRLTMSDGKPAAGAKVRIREVAANFPGDLRGTVRLNDGLRFGQASDLPKEVFPLEYQSNADGEIVINHLPPDVSIECLIDDQPQFPACSWKWSVKANERNLTIVPAVRVIRGEVLAGDTGEPLAGAVATSKVILAVPPGFLTLDGHAPTDTRGKFVLTTPLMSNNFYSIAVHTPVGSAYRDKTFQPAAFGGQLLPEGDLKIRLDRGSLVSGHITDAGTGLPVPDAVISYSRRTDPKFIRGSGLPVAISDRDGNFSFAVEPGAGDLAVGASSCEFALQPLRSEHLPGTPQQLILQELVFAHAVVDVPAGAVADVQLTLNRGKTVRGEIVGSDGAIPWLVGMRHPYPQNGGYTDNYRIGWTIRHGHFAVHGVPAGSESRVAFFDPVAKEGKYIAVHGNDADAQLKIQLEKCGSATVKFVDEERKPVANQTISVWANFSEETDPIAKIESPQKMTLAASVSLNTFDATNHSNFTTDADGKLALPAPVPGLTYRVGTGNRDANNVLEYVDIRVSPSQHVEVPEVLVKKAAGPLGAAWLLRRSEKRNRKRNES